VLAAQAHEAPFRRALRGLIPAQNLIVEPLARGTAVAIAYGAAVIRRRLGDGVIASVAADHHIVTGEQYRRTLADAIGLAAAQDSIVAIGIPRRGLKQATAIRRSARRLAPDFESRSSSRNRRLRLRAEC